MRDLCEHSIHLTCIPLDALPIQFLFNYPPPTPLAGDAAPSTPSPLICSLSLFRCPCSRYPPESPALVGQEQFQSFANSIAQCLDLAHIQC